MTFSTRNSPITYLFSEPPVAQYQKVQASSQYLTMRDGVQIAIDLMLPAPLAPGARIPTILIMARYWRSFEMRVPDQPNKAWIGPREAIAGYLLPRGFAIVVVDARGAGASTGVNRYPWSPEERADYGEVATWVLSQPWSNGKVGATGISYEGATAQFLLASGVAGAVAAAPMEYEFDVYPDIALPGGVFNTAFIRDWSESNQLLDANKMSSLFPWSARLFVKGVRPTDADRKSKTVLAQALREHQANTNVFAAVAKITYRDDPFGATGATLDDFSVFKQKDAIEASHGSLFVFGSWLDGTTADTVLRVFNTLSNPQIGVIGAWKHEMSAHASPYVKSKSKPDPLQEQQWAAVAHFFEKTLVAGEPLQGKKLFYYTLGEEAWKETDVFPPANVTPQTWYFREDHGLEPAAPVGAGQFDAYQVDFEATTGKENRWLTQMARPVNYTDRAGADRRLLTYTSAPLAQDLAVTGYTVVTLYVASSHEDSAFFVYLEDVDEKGVVRYVTEGQLRAIHRKLATDLPPYWSGVPHRTFKCADGAPLPVNEVVELTFGLHPTSVRFRQGHRIRVAIAGADKDTFARIPATGVPAWQVWRSGENASSITLPVQAG
ncbi:MAG: CocE/NonD family hydrolase [Anaerolineales bacterium]|nr:CocE/NonD family hydrolase [Anaerolineales bacterium]